MTVAEWEEIATLWEDVNRAARKVETSLPQQMSAAIAELERARLTFETRFEAIGRTAS